MRNKKQKPEITVTKSEGIFQFGTRKKVTKFGNSGHVPLPKALVGESVDIYYMEPKTEKVIIFKKEYKKFVKECKEKNIKIIKKEHVEDIIIVTLSKEKIK